MKILVITACTAKKKWDRQVDRANQLKPEDFATVPLRNRRSEKLHRYKTRAAEMYTGDGHKRLMNGVKNLRRTFGPDVVDLYIISPCYGLLNEVEKIVPYDYDFKNFPVWKIQQRSKKLKIKSTIESLLSRYDLAFFLLSEPYIIACLPCKLPFCVEKPVVQIFLVAEGAQKRIPPNPHIRVVHPGGLVDRLEGANNYNVKEIVFERLCKLACKHGKNHTGNGGTCDPGNQVFEEVKRNPQRIIEMVLECNKGR